MCGCGGDPPEERGSKQSDAARHEQHVSEQADKTCMDASIRWKCQWSELNLAKTKKFYYMYKY